MSSAKIYQAKVITQPPVLSTTIFKSNFLRSTDLFQNLNVNKKTQLFQTFLQKPPVMFKLCNAILPDCLLFLLLLRSGPVEHTQEVGRLGAHSRVDVSLQAGEMLAIRQLYSYKMLPKCQLYSCKMLPLRQWYKYKMLPLRQWYTYQMLPLCQLYSYKMLPLRQWYKYQMLPIRKLYSYQMLACYYKDSV